MTPTAGSLGAKPVATHRRVTSMQTIAWDGITIAVPSAWSVHTLDRGYLKTVADDGIVFELKWRTGQKKFNVDRFFNRFLKGLRRKEAGGIDPRPLPTRWLPALAGYTARGFEWNTGDRRALGVLTHCPVCNTAALMQWSGRPAERLETLALPMLDAFRDHGMSDWQAWRIFDIHARVPKAYALQGHRFLSGSFQMAFKSAGSRLSLYRWGPAGALLASTDLRRFARERLDTPRAATLTALPDSQGWHWHSRPPAGIRSWLANLLQRDSAHARGRIWHLADRNRILAVVMSSRRPIDNDTMNAICTHYGCSP